MHLFVLGSANIDLTFRVPGMPRPGVTEVCPYMLGFGGKGANQAVQAARLGASVTFCGKVGDDPFGPAIIDQLKKEGIVTDYVTTAAGLLTGTAVILVESSGQNSIITHAGPNVVLSADDVGRAVAAIQSADVLLATLEVNAEPLIAALRTARAAGVRTILNPAPPVDFPHEILELVDICLPNESELVALTGIPIQEFIVDLSLRERNVPLAEREVYYELPRAAEALRMKGPNAIVVTLGDQGAFLMDDRGAEMIPACSVQAVDTSGAGDAFAASLAVALGEGKSLREAAAWANRVAALSVSHAGTQASFPTREEIKGFRD